MQLNSYWKVLRVSSSARITHLHTIASLVGPYSSRPSAWFDSMNTRKSHKSFLRSFHLGTNKWMNMFEIVVLTTVDFSSNSLSSLVFVLSLSLYPCASTSCFDALLIVARGSNFFDFTSILQKKNVFPLFCFEKRIKKPGIRCRIWSEDFYRSLFRFLAMKLTSGPVNRTKSTRSSYDEARKLFLFFLLFFLLSFAK